MVARKSAKETAAAKKTALGNASTLYRRLALALPHVVEGSHMGATDFRIAVAGKRRIFATLAFESRGLGTIMLDGEQQAALLCEAPEWFEPAPGGWGRLGATLLRLDAPESVLADALETAHHHILGKMVAKRPVAQSSKS